MSRTVIIDGDVLIYKTAEGVSDSFEAETEEDDDFVYRVIGWANKKQAAAYLEALLEEICSACKARKAVICLSDAKANFRKKINPSYKRNRKPIKPILYEFLRNYMKKYSWKVYEKPELEADDVIGILATSTKVIKGDKVVWSLDKDFKTIPCKFHRAKPDGTHESKVITEQEADWWFMYQTLTGDSTDGYSGCRGVGDKTARKILGEPGTYSLQKMWELVKNTYQKMGQTEEDALLNARMARILRAEDYNFKKKEIRLWSP